MFDVIAFDGDDTLWHNENIYADVQDKFVRMLSSFSEPETSLARLHEKEMHNLETFGYGVKGFVVSLIEAAIDLSGGKIPAACIQQLIDYGREMILANVDVFEQAAETLEHLAAMYPLALITKGDLSHQESKLKRSGLKEFFRFVEIVTEKNVATYAAIFDRHGFHADRVLMVGNSLRSDVLPILELGGWAVHIPYSRTWAHEEVGIPEEFRSRWTQISHLSQLLSWIASNDGTSSRE